jgi:hypothetical protein
MMSKSNHIAVSSVVSTPNLQDLFAKVDALLDGIDRQEDDPRGGYWKTSDGAKVGKIMLRNLKELLTRELTQPDPEGGLLGLDDLRDAWNAQADAANSWDELGLDEIICFAQQAIVRQCRPAVAPVGVADRQPTMEAGDLDNQGRCWWGDAGDEQFVPSWRLCERPDDSHFTHWQPHWAIPLPTTTQEPQP